MNLLKTKSTLTLLLLVILHATSYSQEFIEIGSIQESMHLAKKSILVEDKDGAYSLNDIINEKYEASHIKEVHNDIPYIDFTSSTYWMKIPVQNSSLTAVKYYIEVARPLTNKVNLIVLDEFNKPVQEFKTGDDFQFNQRPLKHKNFVFPVEFQANSKYKLVVQATSDGEILKLPVKLWQIEAFTQFTTIENFFLGLYYGLFLLVIVFFTFFGIALRQRLYVYFVTYVFFLGLFQLSLDGLAYQYLWPQLPWLGNHAILILAAISLLSMLLYVRKFLEFADEHRTYNKIYSIFIGLTILGLALSFSSGTPYAINFPFLNGLSFIVVFYFLYGIVLRAKSGQKTEFPIVMAFIFLCLGAIFFILSNVNIINNEFLAANALKVGSAIEVTFLSIAMASRYRQTQVEKIEAQQKAFEALEEVNKLKNEQTERLEKLVAERTQEIVEKNDILSSQNHEIINSINYAKRLQDAILPSEKSMKQLFKDSFVIYKPKDIVSGDFYWVEEMDDNLFFAVADCTGHGVPGAMVSVLGNNSLNRCINEFKLREPAEILDKLTELIENTLNKNATSVSDGMDITLCVWDKKSKLQFAGANNPLYLIRNGELIETKGDKQPIGKFFKREPFTTHEFELKAGDSIYLFSDGYADQFGGPKGKKLKYASFKNYLLELNDKDSNSIKSGLSERFEAWKGELEQIDDVCIMHVKF